MLVRRVREHDCLMAVRSQSLHVGPRILDIQISTNRGFVFHEAQIPVRDSMMLQPSRRLAYRLLVEILDVKAVGNDSNPDITTRQATKRRRCSGDGLKRVEETPLCHGESMQVFVFIQRSDFPLRQPVADVERQGVRIYATPFCCDGPEPGVKIRNYAVEINAQHEAICRFSHALMPSNARCQPPLEAGATQERTL